jgi:hypothetical protein
VGKIKDFAIRNIITLAAGIYLALILAAAIDRPDHAAAQVSNPSIVLVASAPSGSCTTGLPLQVVSSTGALYSCQSGTWGQISGGGGGATLGANTFTGTQTVDTSSGSPNSLVLKSTNTSQLPTIDFQSAGGHEWQFQDGGTAFGGVYFYLNDATASKIGMAWGNTEVNLRSDYTLGFVGGSNPTATTDTGISRDTTLGSGWFDFGTGTNQNASGSLQFNTFVGSTATQPTGACSPSGSWIFTKDGHASFCNAGTWASKI